MSTEPVFVYVVEAGCYDSMSISGVYSSLQDAKDANPGNVWTDNDEWSMNEKDWDDARLITRFQVLGSPGRAGG